jgi:hypothetical protein
MGCNDDGGGTQASGMDDGGEYSQHAGDARVVPG